MRLEYSFVFGIWFWVNAVERYQSSYHLQAILGGHVYFQAWYAPNWLYFMHPISYSSILFSWLSAKAWKNRAHSANLRDHAKVRWSCGLVRVQYWKHENRGNCWMFQVSIFHRYPSSGCWPIQHASVCVYETKFNVWCWTQLMTLSVQRSSVVLNLAKVLLNWCNLASRQMLLTTIFLLSGNQCTLPSNGEARRFLPWYSNQASGVHSRGENDSHIWRMSFACRVANLH